MIDRVPACHDLITDAAMRGYSSNALRRQHRRPGVGGAHTVRWLVKDGGDSLLSLSLSLSTHFHFRMHPFINIYMYMC